MIKVVHVNDKLSMDGQNPSSVARLHGDWIPLLRQHGVECSVCTLRDPDPGAGYLEEQGIPVRRFEYGRLSPRNLHTIFKVLREEGAEIAHLHGFGAANFGRLAARRLGIANVVHEHAILEMPLHQRLADRVLAGWTDAAIAVSESVREFMVHGRSIPPDCIAVIGNGVDLQRFAPLDDAAVAAKRHELSIPDGHRVVGTVTRLRAEKGTEYLLRAVPGVLQRVPSLTILIAGDGPLRESLESLARRLGIERHVRFLGFRDDVPQLLGVMDVLVVPSLTEGFALSMVEGMAAGCSIVATRVGGLAEIGQEGKNLLFVPSQDPGALGRRTIEVLENPALAQHLAREATRSAADHSMTNAARRLANLYDGLVSRNGRLAAAERADPEDVHAAMDGAHAQ